MAREEGGRARLGRCKDWLREVVWEISTEAVRKACRWLLFSEDGAAFCAALDATCGCRYAGFGSVFACSPSRCHNCRARGPIVETVDISAALQRLGLSHHEAVLQVAVVNELMQVVPLNMTTLPSPEIVAPLFCTNKGQDGALSDPARKGDIMSLQVRICFAAANAWYP